MKFKLSLPGVLGAAAVSVLGGRIIFRGTARYITRKIAYPILTEQYEKNIWELVTSVNRFNPHRLVGTELRSHTEDFIERPIGGPRRFTYLDNIMFNSAQLDILPTSREENVDTGVVIGPKARKPLKVNIPVLIAGMGYGVALSEEYKIAIAKGASAAGTATNTGHGPWLDQERKAARKLIIQYSRMSWNNEENIIKQSDAVEIQFGQGANAGAGKTKKADKIGKKLRNRMGLKKGEDAVIHNRIEDVGSQKDLQKLVEYLKHITGGVPVGVKIAAGKYLEKDLEIITGAGVDFVSIDGGEGGTHASLPVLEDDFGLPTLIAICRASRFWEEHGLKGKISLLAGGGIATPGDCLKMLALGADAVYMGTAVLLAVTHVQILKVLPFNPPTELAYYDGSKKKKFNTNEGAKSLAHFLHALVYEMEEAVKALGKTSTRELTRDDIFAIDRDVAEMAGIPLGFHPPPPR